jgi:peptidoglycan/LPS O-acetylase OafA/YrhL
MKARIESLDFLRGLAILFTIQGHWIGYSDSPGEWIRLLSRLIPNGYFGVRLFFLVSGYIITLIFLREIQKRNTISVSFFFMKRALRILPVYVLYLLTLIGANDILNLQLKANDFLYPSLFLVCFSNNLDWVVSHFWSLNVEEWFYIFFPFSFYWVLKIKKQAWFNQYFPWILFVFTITLYLHSMCIERNDNHLFKNLIYLSVGVLFAFKNDYLNRLISGWNSKLMLILAFMTMVIYAVVNPYFVNLFNQASFTDVSTLVANTVVFLSIAFHKGDFHLKVMKSKVGRTLSYLGTACYSLYVWQELFLRTSLATINQFPFNIILVFIVGLMSFELVEKFFEKKKKALVQRNPVKNS